MIKVEDYNDRLDLSALIYFFGSEAHDHRWEIFDLEYSGRDFNGESPEKIEKQSKDGMVLSFEGFSSFVSTIEQVIEGVFILRAEDASNVPCKEEEASLVKILICDGAFWEIGGEKADEFIDSVGLMRLHE